MQQANPDLYEQRLLKAKGAEHELQSLQALASLELQVSVESTLNAHQLVIQSYSKLILAPAGQVPPDQPLHRQARLPAHIPLRPRQRYTLRLPCSPSSHSSHRTPHTLSCTQWSVSWACILPQVPYQLLLALWTAPKLPVPNMNTFPVQFQILNASVAHAASSTYLKLACENDRSRAIYAQQGTDGSGDLGFADSAAVVFIVVHSTAVLLVKVRDDRSKGYLAQVPTPQATI